jgi:hypothetical protein
VLTLPLVPMNERVTRPSRTFRGPAGGLVDEPAIVRPRACAAHRGA